ncbi:homeodomain-like protein [Rhizophagus irregularis DAOM 181602=DAOM 197198]|nr:homeodomain-like protein [Rhizophagus irregularis DAOM 181602=DAOM 197198]
MRWGAVILQELVKDKIDWYLDELVEELELRIVGREYKPEQLIFMDEASKDERTLSRGYGYFLKNTFATKKNVFMRSIRYTILSALLLQGIYIAVDIMEGSCIKEKFREFVISNVPQMNAYSSEYSVLVLDNARIHHDKDLIEYIESFGRRVEFLPLIP